MKKFILMNADIWTGSPRQPGAEALVAEDGRIVHIGTSAEIAAEIAPGDEVLDAKGRRVVPGFIDTHVHFTLTGLGHLVINLDGVDSLQAVQERLRLHHERYPGDSLLLALNFQPELNPQKRFPTPEELDVACGGRPVYVMDRSAHWSAVNRAAFALLDMPADTPGVLRDEAGQFTGVLTDQANTAALEQFWQLFSRQVGLKTAIQKASHEAVRGGITTVHALEEWPSVPTLLSYEPVLPVSLVIYSQTRKVSAVCEAGLRQIGGCGSVMLDGDFSPHTAALLEPYTDAPHQHGTLYYEDNELYQYILQAHLNGLQVALHSVGSAAIEQLLRAYERVLREHPRKDHRHRIEHFELPAPGHAERAKKLGLCLALQPAFNHFWPHHGEYPSVIGPDRARMVDPLGSLVKEGLTVAIGSDSPVTPMNPMLSIHSAVNHSNPSERVDVETALRLATQAGAYLAFEEGIKGTLEVGKRADLVVLSEDPLQVAPERLREIEVLWTVNQGNIVYTAGEGE